MHLFGNLEDFRAEKGMTTRWQQHTFYLRDPWQGSTGGLRPSVGTGPTNQKEAEPGGSQGRGGL